MFGQTKEELKERIVDGKIVVYGNCGVTKKHYAVTIPISDTKGYQTYVTKGGIIQQLLPNVSADDREFIISGTSPEGWTQMFGENPED
jgi:hypothetical protein